MGIANPCAAIASAALMLRHSLGLEAEATAVEEAITQAIAAGARTADIAGDGETRVSTDEMTDEIIRNLS
jgi:3-isopropylmalate dehydrogenase